MNPIHIPPLRERLKDISGLAHHPVNGKPTEMGIKTPVMNALRALDRLIGYRWSGNVRELKNALNRELIKNRTGPLHFDSSMARKLKSQIDLHPDVNRETETLDCKSGILW